MILGFKPLTIGMVILFISVATLLPGCSRIHQVHSDLQMDHNHATATSRSNAEPESQDWARQRLAKSPRHQEWVKIKYKPAGASAEREVSAFVVYPEVKNKATAVLVIHEIFGMSDWVQSLTDELAEAGYVAIAPDLLSGTGPNHGGTSDVATAGPNAIGAAIRDLPPEQITADLDAVAAYVTKLPAANGKLVAAGFCWGGGQTFRYATNNSRLKAAFVFYGPPPLTGQPPALPVDKAALGKISAPVYGFYAGNDARIGASVPATIEGMKDLKRTFEPVTYEGAGHGFMRAGDAPLPTNDADQKKKDEYAANKKARDEAWIRWKAILAKI